jgi:hypothetical protein
MSSRTFDPFSILDTVTRLVTRTTYGFIAGIIGLFLSSLCVIKVVRSLFHLLFCSVPTVLAETRDRAVQENRCKAWGQGLRLRRTLTAFLLPDFASLQRFFSCLQHWQYPVCPIYLAKMVSDVGFLHTLRRITTNRSHSVVFSTQLFSRYSVKLEKRRNYNLHFGIAIDLT